jgi:hypothetical protein
MRTPNVTGGRATHWATAGSSQDGKVVDSHGFVLDPEDE